MYVIFSVFFRYTYGKPVNGTVLVKFSMVGRRIRAVSVRQLADEVILPISLLYLWTKTDLNADQDIRASVGYL